MKKAIEWWVTVTDPRIKEAPKVRASFGPFTNKELAEQFAVALAHGGGIEWGCSLKVGSA